MASVATDTSDTWEDVPGSVQIAGMLPGQLSAGNVDLNHRPVVHNPDGSISTVLSKSFNFGGKEYLLPTVSDDGRIMSDQEAIQTFRKTGKHLGIFDSPASATAYAQALHNQQATQYGNGSGDGWSDVPNSIRPAAQSLSQQAAARHARMVSGDDIPPGSPLDTSTTAAGPVHRFFQGAGIPTSGAELFAAAQHLSSPLGAPVVMAGDLLRMVGGEMGTQAGEAADAAQHGEYGQALKHALGAAVPFIGPPLAEGNVAGAAGRAAALAAPVAAGKAISAIRGTPAPAPETAPVEADATTQPFYGDEGARGPLDATPSRSSAPAPAPSKLRQAAGIAKTVVGAVRHPVLTGAAKIADVVANRLAPESPATAPTLPAPANPANVAALQLADVPPDASPAPTPTRTLPSQLAAAQNAVAQQTADLRRPPLSLDESAIPPSRMQPTSAITPTAPPTSIPTSSRQIALENNVNDYVEPTASQIPAPRPITRKTAQLEIGGEPIGKRVPYAQQLPDATSAMEAARIKGERALQRQLATTAVARDTMQSKTFPQWSADDQQAFGRALNARDPGTAAAVANRAEQQAHGVSDPTFGSVNHLSDSLISGAYNGDVPLEYVDPDGRVTPLTDLPAYAGKGVFVGPDGRPTQISPSDETAGPPVRPSTQRDLRYDDQSRSQPDAAEFASPNAQTGKLDHQNGNLVATTPMNELLPATFKNAGQALAMSQRTSADDKTSGMYGLLSPTQTVNTYDPATNMIDASAPKVGPPDYSNYDVKSIDGQVLANTVTTYNDGTDASSVNDPFVILHEYGHAAYERDLTPQQKKQWSQVIQHYQRKLDQTDEGDYSTVTGVPEAIKSYSGEAWHSFPSLFASYVLDPTALKQKYPDVYYFMKRVSGGREYINANATQGAEH